MRSLRIELLGAPRVAVGGSPLAVDTRKATAILAYLAVSGHVQPRAAIADLLWPQADPERARSALRRTLSTLRSALGEERLLGDRFTVALSLEDTWIDLAVFRDLARDPCADVATLAAAAALHRGDLLAGFALRDSVDFDDWQRDQQELVRREHAGVLDRLAALLAGEGRFDEAIAAASARLALDPLHEPTHRLLMELHAHAGRRGDALARYRECVRVLDRELGVAPLASTTELYHVISGGAPSPAPAVEPAAPASELTLVGRDRELSRLLDVHAQVLEGGGRSLVIEGESGVGKTRLVREALGALAARGTRAIEAGAYAGEQGLAYGVIARLSREALGAAGRTPEEALRPELALLLGELGPAPAGDLSAPGAQLRLLEAVAALLARVLDGGGVIFVDDLQWCDPASLEALAFLARRLQRRGMLMLATWRTDEPDPARRCARFAALGERLTLRRLERADVVSLALRAGLDEREGERVFHESEGLPLFVSELLASGAGAGGVRAAVEARLDAASDAAGQVLGAASLIGRTFDADTLRLASGRSEEEVANALEELTARGLIVEHDEAYDFAHERLRELAEERVSLARRRLLHRRVASALEVRRGDPAIIARHLELAGEDEPAALAHAQAAARARTLSAAAEAIAHLETAVALGHPQPAQLQEAIGDLHTRRGAYADALRAYAAAAARAGAAEAARIEHKLGGVHERRGELELAESHYGEALALGADAAAVAADRSRVAWRGGDLERARALGVEALSLADGAGAVEAAARANNILGLLGAGRGHLERSLELSQGLEDPGIRIAALNNLARHHVAAGELARAEELIREALALCTDHGDLHHEAALRNNLADILHAGGHGEEAMAELKQAVSGFAVVGAEGEELFPGAWAMLEW